MKQRGIGSILFTAVLLLWVPSPSHGRDGSVAGPLLAYAGKTYKGPEDPEYRAYDQVLREVLVKEIHRRFGVALDARKYSGFDLLEIIAFLKCKKSTESFDDFLRLFPKSP